MTQNVCLSARCHLEQVRTWASIRSARTLLSIKYWKAGRADGRSWCASDFIHKTVTIRMNTNLNVLSMSRSSVRVSSHTAYRHLKLLRSGHRRVLCECINFASLILFLAGLCVRFTTLSGRTHQNIEYGISGIQNKLL